MKEKYVCNLVNIHLQRKHLLAYKVMSILFLMLLFASALKATTTKSSEIGFFGNLFSTTEDKSENDKIEISGIVVDNKDQQPIIGATVKVKGTTTGTFTDIDGRFTLNAESNSTLEITYMGYKTQQIVVETSNTNLRIVLVEDLQELDEIVVVGYGTQRRGSIVGSVSNVSGETIVKAPVSDLSNSLAGRLPGLRVVTRSGEPGYNASEIDVRGFGNALIIVDGVPSDFSQLDPNEIDNISVLKDASAAVYGVKAANGVVLVTTKKGVESRTKINFNSTFSWQRPTIYPDFVNAAQFAELTDEDTMNRGGTNFLFGPEELEKWRAGGPGYEGTNWKKLVQRDYAPQQQYNLNIRGGTEKLKYFASLGYLTQDGMWKSRANKFERYNVRSNVDAYITKGLTTSISLSGRKENRDTPSTDAGVIMNSILRNHPTYYPYANGNPDYYAGTNVLHRHPMVISDQDMSGYHRNEKKIFEGSVTLNYDASEYVKGLSAKVMYYYRTRNELDDSFVKKYSLYTYNEASEAYNETYIGNDPSKLTKKNTNDDYKVFQGSISYNNTFAKKHELGGLLLVETREGVNNWFNASREYIIDVIPELGQGSSTNKNNDGSSSETGNIGYVGRLNYAYDNRYLLEFSFRYDGSSNFAKNNRWGFFPSVSAGWRIGQESFIKNNLKFVDDIKLRGSWGRLGDDTFAEDQHRYQYLTGYTYPSGYYMLGNELRPGLVSKGLANPNLTWYTSDLYNIGLDAVLFGGKLSTEIDVFYRKRKDLLAQRAATLPGTFGVSLPLENLESDSDRGLEVVIGHNNRLSNGIQYAVKGNIAYTRSRNEYRERAESITQWDNWRNNQNDRWKNKFFGYKAIGQFESYEQIAEAPVQDQNGNKSLNPGDIIYLDYNKDGIIDGNDEHYIGRGPKPEITFGLDMSAAWKGFDVSVFLQGAANANIMLSGELQAPLMNGNSAYSTFMDRWHREDLYDPNSKWIPGKYPSTRASGNPSNMKRSSFWLQNASYIRVKDVQFGYTIPKNILKRANIESLRLFVSGYNLFTFTGLDLVDPEAPDETQGDYYPQQKVISFGLNLTF